MGGVAQNAMVTQGRVTRAHFDVDETFALVDSGVAEVRRHGAISQVAARDKGANSYRSNFMRLYASGAWGLAPLQLRLSQIQEWSVGAASVFLPASTGVGSSRQIQTAPITLAPKFRRPSGTGMAAAGSGANADGSDLFFRFKVAAGTSWDQSGAVSGETRITNLLTTLAGVRTTTQPMDILARSTNAVEVDAGFCLRFTVPGARQSSPDMIAIFAFGQYALLLGGDGLAALWMYAPYTSGGSSEWRSVRSLRWSKPAQVAGFAHTICIFPHMGEHGEKHVSIISVAMDSTTVTSAGGASTLAPAQGNSGAHSTTEDLWTFDPSVTGQLDVAATGKVTTSTRFYLLERRDLRGEWQVSRLTFPVGTSSPAGKLVGDPHAAPSVPTLGLVSSGAWTVQKLSRESGSMTITPRVKDADTDSTTAIDSPYVIFDFYSDGTATPLLYGYGIQKAATVVTSSPGSFTTPVLSVNLQTGGPDVRGELAHVDINDPGDDWPRLRTRGRLSFRLTTTYTPPGDTEKTITLFRGAAISPRRVRHGTSLGTKGMGESSREWPSPEWSGYSVNCKGMWERLCGTNTRTTLSFETFVSDPAAAPAADGSLVAWKVTDVIKKLLGAAGFPSSMMRIPDLGVRLNPGIGTGDSDRILEPGTNIAQMVVDLARNYLGRWLHFDYNDGAEGKWTLIAPPAAGTITPLFTFTHDMPVPPEGSLVLPHVLHAYPDGVAPTFGRATSYILPPQKNHLWAFSAVNAAQAGAVKIDNHLYNVLSYDVPGFSTAPDPDQGHYIGHEELLTLADPSFWAGGHPLTYAKTQDLVDYVLIRGFTATAMAREIQPIHAPLVFVPDPVHGAYRPLRFYDPVMLDDAGYYIRSVNIAYERDGIQMADYELERLVPYLPAGA